MTDDHKRELRDGVRSHTEQAARMLRELADAEGSETVAARLRAAANTIEAACTAAQEGSLGEERQKWLDHVNELAKGDVREARASDFVVHPSEFERGND